jgi:hypothetical protein
MKTVRSAKRLQWPARPKRESAGGGLGRVERWCDTTRQYRVKFFVDQGQIPFFAMVRVHGWRKWDTLSRHADLAGAMNACAKHAAERHGGQKISPKQRGRTATGNKRPPNG